MVTIIFDEDTNEAFCGEYDGRLALRWSEKVAQVNAFCTVHDKFCFAILPHRVTFALGRSRQSRIAGNAYRRSVDD